MLKPKILERLEPERIGRFWDHVDIGDEGRCWNWTAGKSGDGYGVFAIRRFFRTSTHRIAFALANQTEPGDGHVCHECDNPLCCNPKHLYLGDAKVNAQDKVLKGRARGRFSA